MTTNSPASSSDGGSQGFALLDVRIQRWIWSEGWTALRDAQEKAIPALIDADRDVIIAAATAAGKTEAAFFPILTHVPSFGDWGFNLVAKQPLVVPQQLSDELAGEQRFLDDTLLPTLFVFPRDQQPLAREPNQLDTQLLVRYYEQDLASFDPRRGT